MTAVRDEVIRDLTERIRAIEGPGRARRPVSLGLPALDRLLPDRGQSGFCQQPAGGSLVELIHQTPGSGAWTLALLAAREACGGHKSLVVVDYQRAFFPPAAAQRGVDLDRLLVVRPTGEKDRITALDLSLRCPGVGAVIGTCERLEPAVGRRLAAAAEAGGGLGLLLRPAAAAAEPSFARVRLRLTPVPASRDRREQRVRVDVLRAAGGAPGAGLVLGIDHETHPVRVSAELAAPAAVLRTVRTTG